MGRTPIPEPITQALNVGIDLANDKEMQLYAALATHDESERNRYTSIGEQKSLKKWKCPTQTAQENLYGAHPRIKLFKKTQFGKWALWNNLTPAIHDQLAQSQKTDRTQRMGGHGEHLHNLSLSLLCTKSKMEVHYVEVLHSRLIRAIMRPYEARASATFKYMNNYLAILEMGGRTIPNKKPTMDMRQHVS